MGLLQKACETYDNHAHLAGVFREGHEVLVPISHSLTGAKTVVIEITVDADGKLVSAEAVSEKNSKTIFPVTEKSAGRTATGAAEHPHPLCDKLKYLTPKKKNNFYIPQLETWCNSPYTHPKLKPILTYVKAGTIGDDLARIFEKDKTILGLVEKGEAFIRWRVIGIGEEYSGACWRDPTLFDSFIQYYGGKCAVGKTGLCMITGEELPLAEQHPKGIIPIAGNAKLISANDGRNFTYRGRFKDEEQVATVSYIASQKAHNALRWLASESGTRVFTGGVPFCAGIPKGCPFQCRCRVLERKHHPKPLNRQNTKSSCVRRF